MASPVLILSVIGILFAAPNASGQAAIEQYTPQPDPGGGSGGAVGSVPSDTLGPGSEAAPGVATHSKTPSAVVAKTGDGSSSGGTLPATDYPVTPFVWIVLGVLATGVLVRIASPLLGRRRARGAS